ncbi:hypothetical protein [Marinobacter sp.]|uniref:hypothetical protein n=1 Tax=Marinobacter sp. TaxID=50741 RepID=UPI003976E762
MDEIFHELTTDLTQERRWPIEEHDPNEMLGNLLDNAGRWSEPCVELSLLETREQTQLVVNDDGLEANVVFPLLATPFAQ